MKQKYVLLRSHLEDLTRDPFNLPVRGLSVGSAYRPPSAPKVEVDELETHDVLKASRDRSVVALARVMPLKLIKPVKLPEPVAEGQAIQTWGVEAVGASNSAFDGAGVRVAVLDTGIDAAHPAFANMEIQQRDFTGEGDGDAEGHGTHCAGTIFGRDVGGVRIGVARGVTSALIGKVLGENGGGSSDGLFEAMQWAFNGGAKIVSMSLGFDFPGMVAELVNGEYPVEVATSMALEAYRANLRMFDVLMALARARFPLDGGAIVVAASGNESNRPKYELSASLPAAADGVVSVGALERTAKGLDVAGFSNVLPTLAAPGVDIVSARTGGGLLSLSGTSMATPHVAGVAALWWQAAKQRGLPLNAATVTANLIAAARTEQLAQGTGAGDRGAGLVTAP